jgi:hypothetical protein
MLVSIVCRPFESLVLDCRLLALPILYVLWMAVRLVRMQPVAVFAGLTSRKYCRVQAGYAYARGVQAIPYLAQDQRLHALPILLYVLCTAVRLVRMQPAARLRG